MESVPAVNCRQSKIVFFATGTFCARFYEIKILDMFRCPAYRRALGKTRAALNVRSAINQQAGIPCRNGHFLARALFGIATAGRTLPSTNFEECAPPPVNVGDFVGLCRQVDCPPGCVAAASDGKRFAAPAMAFATISVLYGSSGNSKHANRAVPQNGLRHS